MEDIGVWVMEDIELWVMEDIELWVMVCFLTLGHGCVGCLVSLAGLFPLCFMSCVDDASLPIFG